jgi:hypothetical protein
MTIFGPELSRLRSRHYKFIFISSDIVALTLQAVGGTIFGEAMSLPSIQMGIKVILAGLSWQVFSLTLFLVLISDYGLRVWRSGNWARRLPGAAMFCPWFVGYLFGELHPLASTKVAHSS